MLTDAALRNLKPKSKLYKASGRDDMYLTVSPTGTVTFRYDYRLHGRRETLTPGRYSPDGISLAVARELLLDARKTVFKGISPALEKQREKRRVVAIKTFGAALETWLANARWADSTRAARQQIIDRDLLPAFQNRLLTEIQAEDLRAFCSKIKERGAPATAVQLRDIVKQVYVYAIAHGEKVGNPQQNAYIERFNRTVRYEWLSQYYWDDLEHVQRFATAWMWTYNHERPNMALGGIAPKQRLAMAA